MRSPLIGDKELKACFQAVLDKKTTFFRPTCADTILTWDCKDPEGWELLGCHPQELYKIFIAQKDLKLLQLAGKRLSPGERPFPDEGLVKEAHEKIYPDNSEEGLEINGQDTIITKNKIRHAQGVNRHPSQIQVMENNSATDVTYLFGLRTLAC